MNLLCTISYNGKQKVLSGESFTVSYGATQRTYFEAYELVLECKDKYMTNNLTINDEVMFCANHLMSDNVAISITEVAPITYVVYMNPTYCQIEARGEDDRVLTNGSTVIAGETITWVATAELGYHFGTDNNVMTKSGFCKIDSDYTIVETAELSIYNIKLTTVGEGYVSVIEDPNPSRVTYNQKSRFNIELDSDTRGVNITCENATVNYVYEEGDEHYEIIPSGTGDIWVNCEGLLACHLWINTTNATVIAWGSVSGQVYNGSELEEGETITWSATKTSDDYEWRSIIPANFASFTAKLGENYIEAKAMPVAEPINVVTTVGYPNWVQMPGLPRENYYSYVEPSSGWKVGDTVTVTCTTPTTEAEYVRWGKWQRSVDGFTRYTHSQEKDLTEVLPEGNTVTYTPCYQMHMFPESSSVLMGTVSGGGWYYPNQESFTIKATPNSGYAFVNWLVDGEIFSANNPCAITTGQMVKPYKFIANFEEAYTINLSKTSNFYWSDGVNEISSIEIGKSAVKHVWLKGNIDDFNRLVYPGTIVAKYEPQAGTSEMEVIITASGGGTIQVIEN